jgi:transcriptional regulator with XRE-family HTH domain
MSKPIEAVHRQVGAKVEALRTTLGWTQQELADKVGLSRGSIANIELGRQRLILNDIETFAAAFNIKPAVIMRGIWT